MIARVAGVQGHRLLEGHERLAALAVGQRREPALVRRARPEPLHLAGLGGGAARQHDGDKNEAKSASS